MSIPALPSLRFGLFVTGQIFITLGAFALLFNYLPFVGGVALVILGGVLLGFGGPSMNAQMRAAFPLRVRLCLFLCAVLLLGAAFFLRSGV